MALCYTRDYSAQTKGYFGKLVGSTETALFIDLYNEIQTDLLPLVPSGFPIWYAHLSFRCVIRSTVDPAVRLQEFQGAVPRYKLGRYTFVNNDYYDEVMFVSYVQQQTKVGVLLITDAIKEPLDIETPCEIPDDTRTLISIPINLFGQDGFVWNYATDILLDPNEGVEFEYAIFYSGFLVAGLFDFGTAAYAIANF